MREMRLAGYSLPESPYKKVNRVYNRSSPSHVKSSKIKTTKIITGAMTDRWGHPVDPKSKQGKAIMTAIKNKENEIEESNETAEKLNLIKTTATEKYHLNKYLDKKRKTTTKEWFSNEDQQKLLISINSAINKLSPSEKEILSKKSIKEKMEWFRENVDVQGSLWTKRLLEKHPELKDKAMFMDEKRRIAQSKYPDEIPYWIALRKNEQGSDIIISSPKTSWEKAIHDTEWDASIFMNKKAENEYNSKRSFWWDEIMKWAHEYSSMEPKVIKIRGKNNINDIQNIKRNAIATKHTFSDEKYIDRLAVRSEFYWINKKKYGLDLDINWDDLIKVGKKQKMMKEVLNEKKFRMKRNLQTGEWEKIPY
jgi:hypothetical protein